MVNKYTDSNIEKMAEEMCDTYCKFPGEIKEDDLLQDVCNRCPLNKFVSDIVRTVNT